MALPAGAVRGPPPLNPWLCLRQQLQLQNFEPLNKGKKEAPLHCLCHQNQVHFAGIGHGAALEQLPPSPFAASQSIALKMSGNKVTGFNDQNLKCFCHNPPVMATTSIAAKSGGCHTETEEAKEQGEPGDHVQTIVSSNDKEEKGCCCYEEENHEEDKSFALQQVNPHYQCKSNNNKLVLLFFKFSHS